MAPQLAWLGLGNMGRGMVRNLAAKADLDSPILIWNRSPQRAAELHAELGAAKVTVAPSVAAAVAAADIIYSCVSDDPSIQQTLDAALGTPGGVAGKLFVDSSTVHPDTTDALAARVEAAGAHFVAAPVFGAPAAADAGQLICVFAGPPDAVARVRRFAKGVMGRDEIDFAGRPPSNATLLKVIGNTFVLQMVEALSEGHALAETSGLGVNNLHAFIQLMFPGPYAAYSARMLAGDYYGRDDPLWAVDLARKDARHAKALAAKSGLRLKAVEVADEHLATVKEEKGVKGDLAGIYGVVRTEAGLPWENGKRA